LVQTGLSDPSRVITNLGSKIRLEFNAGRVIGTTQSGITTSWLRVIFTAFGNKSNVILAPGSFRTSENVLTGIIGHEYVHVDHYFRLGFPTDASIDASEYAAYDFSESYFTKNYDAHWLGRATYWKGELEKFKDASYTIPDWLKIF
jgi:hypothetical protein